MKEPKVGDSVSDFPDYKFPDNTIIWDENSFEYVSTGYQWFRIGNDSNIGYSTNEFFRGWKIKSIPAKSAPKTMDAIAVGTAVGSYAVDSQFPDGTVCKSKTGVTYRFRNGAWKNPAQLSYGNSLVADCIISKIPEAKPDSIIGQEVTSFPNDHKFEIGTTAQIDTVKGHYVYDERGWRHSSFMCYYSNKNMFEAVITSVPDKPRNARLIEPPSETSTYVNGKYEDTFRCIQCKKNRQRRFLSAAYGATCTYCYPADNKNPSTPPAQTKEITTMSTTSLTPVTATYNMVLEAGAAGAKAGAAAELCSFMVEGVRETFHENLYVQMALKSPLGNWCARLLLPILLYFLVSWNPRLSGPVDAENIKKVCYYAHQGNMTLVIGPISERLTPFLKQLAGRVTSLAE